MSKNLQRLFGLTCLIITFSQGIKGFFIVRGQFYGLPDKAHRLFVFLYLEIRVSQSPEGRSILRVLLPGLIEESYRFFILVPLKLQSAQVRIYLKTILFYGPGDGKPPVCIIG